MLGGGGARGAAQVGVLQGLFEAGVEPPVRVVAVSVGALNGSAIAAYPSLAGVMMLRELWVSPQAMSVFRMHPLGVIMTGLRREGPSALPQTNVRKLVDRAESLTGFMTFEQLRLPLSIVATDFNSGRKAIFRSGDLTPALLATTAIPGVFPSVVIDGREHMDGIAPAPKDRLLPRRACHRHDRRGTRHEPEEPSHTLTMHQDHRPWSMDDGLWTYGLPLS